MCILQLYASVQVKLTVYTEVNTSGQVGFHVFKIGRRARVHTTVCALDRLQHQDTTLTVDRFPLKVKRTFV